jgi:hypothetical protein
VYLCTLVTGYSASDSGVIKWTSPVTTRRFSVDLDATVPDTAINYVCTVDLGTNKYGFIYDPSDGDDSTLALLLDNLVDSFNNVAGMKDTIAAEDSATYIKLVGEIAQIGLEGDARWTLVLGDSITESDSSFTTVAMACDSMVAYANADDTASVYITGYDSTTFWIIQSDKKGLAVSAFLGDTTQDTARSQSNVTSRSVYHDTIFLSQNILNGQQAKGINGVFILDSSLTTTSQGIGLNDSCQLVFAVGRQRSSASGVIFELFELDSATATDLPCSLRVSRDPAAAGADTLFKEYSFLVVYVSDTSTDTNATIYYRLWQDYILLDD